MRLLPVALALTALPILALLPLGASAAPYGGLPLKDARVELQAGPGLALHRPDLLQMSDGVAIRGAVCRAAGHVAVRAVTLRVQRLDATGRVLAEAAPSVRGALSARDRGCAFYTARTAWTLAPTDSVRVCADRGVCGAHATAD